MRRLPTLLLAALALAGAPAAAHDGGAASPAGIAHTTEVVVNQVELYIVSNYLRVREAAGPYAAHVAVDVRAAVERDEDDRAGVTYRADLRCPPGVSFAAGETGSRTGVAWDAASTFSLTAAKHGRRGHERDTLRCWMRVVITSAATDSGARTTYRDVLLPVDVHHARRALPWD